MEIKLYSRARQFSGSSYTVLQISRSGSFLICLLIFLLPDFVAQSFSFTINSLPTQDPGLCWEELVLFSKIHKDMQLEVLASSMLRKHVEVAKWLGRKASLAFTVCLHFLPRWIWVYWYRDEFYCQHLCHQYGFCTRADCFSQLQISAFISNWQCKDVSQCGLTVWIKGPQIGSLRTLLGQRFSLPQWTCSLCPVWSQGEEFEKQRG